MIQQTDARQRQGTSDGPLEWGHWSGRKYYSLQIVQHPLRARMCGFGDKDRRPLAPAAVAKMVVRRDDNSLVDVDDIDCSFFLVTVDLWSADGKQEMNLVLHPSSADRYVPPAPQNSSNSTKPRRRGVTSSMGPPASSSSTSNPNSVPAVPSTPGLDPNTTSWGYPPWNEGTGGGDVGYRAWNSPDPNAWSQQQGFYDYAAAQTPMYASPPSVPSMGPSIRPPYTPSHANFSPSIPPVPSIPSTPGPASSFPLPRHSYTRTLVGPLSANATRLLDEHRKAGVFFLFQDLSVRTEGTFRLRMRLMNVGRYPAPESGATGVMSIDDDDTHGHPGVSPVLAQVFTEPFTVYSAKRFPGVPDTTALSIALGNQGQKLPLRNRNGSSSSVGKRQRNEEESGEESE